MAGVAQSSGYAIAGGAQKDGTTPMIHKVFGIALLLVGTGALVGPVAPALAGGGPVDYADCVVTVDPSTFAAGAIVTVVGTGFQPNFETTIGFDSVGVVVGTVITDDTGGFTIEVMIPADATPGPHPITAVCDAQGNIITTSVTVSSSGAATTTTTTLGGGALPRTGSEVEPLVVAGGAAVVAGTAVVLVAKRRRRSVA